MEAVATVLTVFGYVGLFVGGIWLLVVAFSESVVWGLLCLFVPFAGLVFAVTHWPEAKRPFLIQMAGLAVLLVGTALHPSA